jgi:chromosome segregation ATPase
MWPFSSVAKDRGPIPIGPNQTAADVWDAAQEASRQSSSLAAFLSENAIQHGADAIESAEMQRLQVSAPERRLEISRLRSEVSAHQQELERLRASEKDVNERLSDLNVQRDRVSREFARQDNADPEEHDAALGKIDREITRCNSRLSGLRRLIAEVDQGSSRAGEALKPLERDETRYQQHLAARQERKELASIAESALKALETKEKAEQQLAQALLSLRDRNHASASNRTFALQLAEKLGRRLSGFRD